MNVRRFSNQTRAHTLRLARARTAASPAPTQTFASDILDAIVACGGGARELVEPLLAPIAADLVRCEAWSSFVPRLGALGMVVAAQSVGLEVPGFTPALALSWIEQMATAADEDQRYHRVRGLAALIWGQPTIARGVAGLSRSHEVGAGFGLNLQAFQAQLVVASAARDPAFRPAWEELLRGWPSFCEAEMVFPAHLLWYAAAVHPVLGGSESVADWLQAELWAAAGLEPPEPCPPGPA
jgi:hypothetical protein